MPAQDPWRKAYTLSRARTPEDAQPGTRTGRPLPPHLRQRRAVWPWMLLLAALLGAGGYYAWTQRGVLIPRYAEELPPPVAKTVEQAPLPRQELDLALLDGGLDIGLAVGADYLNLLGATREWGIEWKLIELGSARTRLSAPGVTAYAANGRIRGYLIDIKKVYAEPLWEPWRKELALAGISPDLNWRTATGAGEMPQGVTEHVLTGRGGQNFAGEAADNSYTLYFREGWLTRIEAGLSTGAPVPDPVIEEPEPQEDPQPVEVPIGQEGSGHGPPQSAPPGTAGQGAG